MFGEMTKVASRLNEVRNDVVKLCEEKHPVLFQQNEFLNNKNKEFKAKLNNNNNIDKAPAWTK